MSTCIVCGTTRPTTRLSEPGSPTKVAIVDTLELAKLVHGGAGTFDMHELLDLLAKSKRFVVCDRCGSLSRLGNHPESWIVGPVEPPSAGARRAVVVTQRRLDFEELWLGARTFAEVSPAIELLVGDVLSVIETYPQDQCDPAEAPRFIRGIVTSIASPVGTMLASLRIIERGVEDRSIETRRTRLLAALDETGAHVASASVVLGISVGETYKWIHELGLADRIKRYKARTRRRADA